MKRAVAIILCLLLILSGCAKNDTKVKITGTDTKLLTKIESMVELQKNVFLGTILDVKQQDAVLTKYNVDISTYTVYTVDIKESFDRFTPQKTIKLYWLGTDEQFNTRLLMQKNESYIFDAEPWVYGDEIIYVLSPYTVSYPQVDVSNNITIKVDEKSALAVCSLDEYRQSYIDAQNKIEKQDPDFFTAKKITNRFLEMFTVIYNKNSNRNFYSQKDRVFDWVPSDELVDKTIATSQKYFDLFSNLKTDDTDKIKNIFK